MVSPGYHRTIITAGGTWRGFRELFALALYSVPFGIAFGAAAAESGMTAIQTIAMSALVFSGTAQFAALDASNAQVGWLSLALVVFAVSARLIVMGATLAPHLNSLSSSRRHVIAFFISDPNFAHSQAYFRKGGRDVGVLLGGGLALWINWVIGTAIGAFAGNLLGDVKAFGFDVVMVCFFATIVVAETRNSTTIAPIILAATVAIATLGWLPTGWNIIAAALVGAAVSLVSNAD